MSSTVFPSDNFQFIFNAALADYLDKTGVDITKDSSTEKLQNCQSADAIIELLQDRANQFKDYRNGNHKLIKSLKPVVQVLHTFSGVLGGVVGLVSASMLASDHSYMSPRPGAVSTNKCNIFWYRHSSQRMYHSYFLSTVSSPESCPPIQAAIAVGTSYDALVELFECVSNFLGRLRVYTEIPSTPTMSGILITIMVDVLSVLALATKQIKQGRFSKPLVYISPIADLGAEKFAKKLLGESEIEAVTQRLDRLTLDEARLTIAQTLQVVHGLVNNVRVVMDGMQVLSTRCQLLTRLARVDGEASTSGIRHALSMPSF